jgi:hypothetical protein
MIPSLFLSRRVDGDMVDLHHGIVTAEGVSVGITRLEMHSMLVLSNIKLIYNDDEERNLIPSHRRQRRLR